jgi:CubicO group peptidase (beta-lactamase class C family)
MTQPATHQPGSLVPLPAQPDGVPWPTDAWPTAVPPPATAAGMSTLLDEITGDTARFGTTYAVAVVQGGRLLAERYGSELEHWDRPNEPVGPTTELLSWSMAKSILHAAVGVLVGDGQLALDMRAPVPEWADRADPRHAIVLDDLLSMRDGLDFAEDYEDIERSDVIRMLFGDAQVDMAHFAADHPLAHEPGAVFNYSSGTSLIVSGIVARAVGAGAPYEQFLRNRLFGPLGMRSTHARFDEAGTFVGSSFVYATTQDYLRFGLLYLRDGVWDGRRLLPEGWVDHGRRARSRDEEGDRWHGAHWWAVGDAYGTFTANGYEGQSLMICPPLDLIVVRLGKSPDETHDPELRAWRARVVEAFA